MSSNLMVKCEQKRVENIDGKLRSSWVVVSASDLPSGEQPDIRCIHCYGKVRVHRKHVDHGPKDHVEHLQRQDSENCKGGHYFLGEHKMSLQPVE